MKSSSLSDPGFEQESMYRLPYHWFPEVRLAAFERNEKQRIIFEMIEQYALNPITRYLDVGCGDGRWTSDIRSHLGSKAETIGIDFSKRAIAFAKLITPQIQFFVHRGEDIPFAENSFDLVTAIEVIEHVDDRGEEQFFRNCSRVLKPSGVFILTTPSWHLKLTQHHFRHYTIERLSKLCKQNGLEILSLRGQSIPFYGPKRKIRKVMGRTPKIWRFWKFTYSEVAPQKALNLIIAARPKIGYR